MILELEIKLLDVGTPVSRSIQVEANSSFYDLHLLIQAVFDWTDSHLHSFIVERTNGNTVKWAEITLDKPTDNNFFQNKNYKEDKELLKDWFVKRNDKMIYIYDYGDNWEHEVIFVKKLFKEDGVTYPRCTKAMNLAPPEDSRWEVIKGEIDLVHNDSSALLKEVNESIEDWIEPISSYKQSSEQIDYWPETLRLAKRFHQLKPWIQMTDEHIFAVIDPISEKYLFCSVLGRAGELYGLAVYIGADGFKVLLDMLSGRVDEFDIFQRQHSLLVSFEDRTDLQKEEYELIKTYDTTFRGKKAWPSFVSYIPGYYPWSLEQEETRMMLLALEQTIAVHEQFLNGLELPDLLREKQILVRSTDNGKFQNSVVDIEEIKFLKTKVQLTISELELKRISKITNVLPITIEFSLTYMNLPIEVEKAERPIFPLATIVADHNDEIVLHHELHEHTLNSNIAQKEFCNIFYKLNGIPQEILIDERTFFHIEPLLESLRVNVEVVERLSVVNAMLEGLQQYLQRE